MFKWVCLTVLCFGVSGCQSSKNKKNPLKSLEEISNKVDVVAPEGVADSAAPQWAWSYGGERGPANWGSLNPEFAMCASGKSQSPVDLVWKAPTGQKKLELNFQESHVTVTNTGYAYRMDFDPQSTITYNGQEYVLEKAELRTPSEHTLSGKQVLGELQLYHRSTNGLRRAIVSLLIVRGKKSDWFQGFVDLAAKTPLYRTAGPTRMNPSLLIPPTRTFYHYEGSLTHPPCLEGVQWFVFNTPIELSKEQLRGFVMGYPQNNRPVQPLNGRSVVNHK